MSAHVQWYKPENSSSSYAELAQPRLFRGFLVKSLMKWELSQAEIQAAYETRQASANSRRQTNTRALGGVAQGFTQVS